MSCPLERSKRFGTSLAAGTYMQLQGLLQSRFNNASLLKLHLQEYWFILPDTSETEVDVSGQCAICRNSQLIYERSIQRFQARRTRMGIWQTPSHFVDETGVQYIRLRFPKWHLETRLVLLTVCSCQLLRAAISWVGRYLLQLPTKLTPPH